MIFARDIAEILHQLNHFIEGFTEADHDAALGEHFRFVSIASGGRALQ
jgi:hypothetical protein